MTGKVDQALPAALAHGAKAPTVIIAIQPGYRAAVRKALSSFVAHGSKPSTLAEPAVLATGSQR